MTYFISHTHKYSDDNKIVIMAFDDQSAGRYYNSLGKPRALMIQNSDNLNEKLYEFKVGIYYLFYMGCMLGYFRMGS
jgi:hypothetical protein